MSAANNLPPITLDELERLIRLLGMLGSAADGEVLAAAKFAQKWVVEHGTDWRTLLTPPEEALAVVGVAASPDPEALEQAHKADRVQAYANGYQAGLRDALTQVKAQAAFAQQAPGVIQQGIGGLGAAMGASWTGLGGGLGGAGAQQATRQGPASGAAQAASGGPAGVMRSWQDACKELLDRAQSIPGVFRKPAEQTFVTDVLTRGFPRLTPAQDKWLRDIAGRNGLSW